VFKKKSLPNHVLTTIQLNFKNWEIKKKNMPPVGFEPAIPGV